MYYYPTNLTRNHIKQPIGILGTLSAFMEQTIGILGTDYRYSWNRLSVFLERPKSHRT